MKVCHLTSAHPRFDSRIFFKECVSLENNGYQVSLIVADGLGEEVKAGISIHDVGKSSGRLNRMYATTRRVFERSLVVDADIYHIHDPELIPVGRKLLRRKKKVIFDAHEDLPKQILAKSYMNVVVRHVLSRVFYLYEHIVLSKFTGVIAATPFIRDKFLKINANTVDINNFPILGELTDDMPVQQSDSSSICYIGGIAKNRGILEIVDAVGRCRHDVRLLLAGVFSEPNVELQSQGMSSWARVDALGYLDRSGIKDVLRRSMAGLVTLHPTINYIDALPVKMFEYMSAGVPVIASDFPLWRSVVIESECGLCVDPLDSQSIARAIDFLSENPEQARIMGSNGQLAIKNKYNWQIEEGKLLDYYKALSR
ncbi:glycosyl transferase [Pseudomonas fildesensis]|uniref:Glycosyl transferase n=1 Tax=Pseudomonas fildesensis TaxID=1674920 RepID=A0A0J8FQP0_9PSED|nr:glycosyl transferase [Pseudomonas fildesensis]